MRTISLIILIPLSINSWAQWKGEVAKYEIFADSLRLNDSEKTGSAWVSKPSEAVENAEWEFRLELKFNPSDNNYALVYPVADRSDLSGKGYFIKIGGRTDEVALYRQDGAHAVKIIDGEDKRVDAASVDIKVKLTRQDGLWTLYTDFAETGYQKEGEITDKQYLSSSYFGVKSAYTSTRADKFYYSQITINGQVFTDNVPPAIDSLSVLTRHSCRLHFNEPLAHLEVNYNDETAQNAIEGNTAKVTFQTPFVENDSMRINISAEDTAGNVSSFQRSIFYRPFEVLSATMQGERQVHITFNKEPQIIEKEHFSLDDKQVSLLQLEEKHCTVTFETPFENRKTVTLNITEIADKDGDILKPFSTKLTYFTPQLGDVVFNEIMADPTPVVGDLPEVEYIELYNASGFTINLDQWLLRVNNSKDYAFPAYLMQNGEYLVIAKESEETLFHNAVKTLLVTNFPTLSNSGMQVQLINKNSDLVDVVNYEKSQHENDFKADGGYALERIDIYNPASINNWSSSHAADGGTPGLENSIAGHNPDLEPPSVENAFAKDSNTLSIRFSEPILKKQLIDTDYYDISDGISIDTVLFTEEGFITNQLMLKMTAPMTVGKIYELKVSGIMDLSENILKSSRHHVAVCRTPFPDEVLINEVMFAPFSGEAEYVEIYNPTDVPFDLSKLKLTQKDNEGTWKTGFALSEEPSLFLPKGYSVITKNKEVLMQCYSINEQVVVEMSAMPTLDNKKGNLALLTANAKVIDELHYDEKWHSTLLASTQGVALERLSSSAPTNEAGNWFSASSLNNYGTPGSVNSQQSPPSVSTKGIKASPKIFTPDGDGTDDFTTLQISEEHRKSTLRIRIFNQRGILVKELASNVLIGSYATVRWDGSDDSGKRCPMGPYVAWVEILSPQGKVTVEKIELVLSVRLQ